MWIGWFTITDSLVYLSEEKESGVRKVHDSFSGVHEDQNAVRAAFLPQLFCFYKLRLAPSKLLSLPCVLTQ